MSFHKTISFVLPAILGSALLLAGCSDYVGKEKTHPLFAKASSCEGAGNYNDAAKSYEEFLQICPKSSVTHYKLAALYGDNLGDPIKAYFHYQKFAELANPTSGDAQDVVRYMEMTKRRIYDNLKSEYKESDSDLQSIREELANKMDLLGKYQQACVQLKTQNDNMRKQILEIREARKRGSKAVLPIGQQPGSGTIATGVGGTAGGTGSTVVSSNSNTSADHETYIVKSGDTLMKISKTIYGSANHYKLILKANPDLNAQGTNLKVDQKLKIPRLGTSSDR